jgi:Leucine-rich repeat (LRR) protein
MFAMSPELRLQVGGTLNPRQHLYVERSEDKTFLRLLLGREYVNVLTSRQMGKSSLMMRTVHQLDQQGVRWVAIDLASELGSPPDLDAYYIGLLSKVVRSLRLKLDLKAWWGARDTDTINQRLLSFFREVVGTEVAEPVVIFLDEIDSTLKLPYTDDLFTAIRGMYNERPIVEAYRRITFCLLGVATPNELIKNRRTTAYNVGTTLELRDFDKDLDDLSPLEAALSPDAEQGRYLLDRVLYWTGGQPYLTQKFCAEIVEKRIGDTEHVDGLVKRTFDTLDHASNDVHFQQILRFLKERLSDEAATIGLYARILRDGQVPDRATLPHAELKLSGLVKRDRNGKLLVRNPIYERLFDDVWVESTRPQRALRSARRYAVAASLAFVVLLGGGAAYYTTVVLPEQQRLAKLDRLAHLGISITRSEAYGGTRALLPLNIAQALLKEAVPLLKSTGSVTEIGFADPEDRGSTDQLPLTRPTAAIDDLSPFADLIDLRNLDLEGPRRRVGLPNIASLEPLKGLASLASLYLGDVPSVTSLEPLKGLTSLTLLRLSDVPNVTSLEPLKRLTRLRELYLDGVTGITSLEPLKGLTSLTALSLDGVTGITSLEPLTGLASLTSLYLGDIPSVTSLEPLTGLTSLTSLRLGDIPSVTSLEPLKGLTSLRSLTMFEASITSLEPLKGLTGLTRLGVYGSSDMTSLEPLKGLTSLTSLSLSRAPRITNLEPLKGLTGLSYLYLANNTGIASLEPLDGLTSLRELNLTGVTGITSLEPLRGLTNLTSLDLSGATGITSLAPLKGQKIDITGASRELLATMQ